MTKKVKIMFILTIVIMVSIVTESILSKGININNPNSDKTATILNEVDKYDTEYIYDARIPSTADPLTIVEGVNGLKYTYDGLAYTKLSDKINAVVKMGTGPQGLYNGKLTGYGPDCPGCSVVGNVSCRTREGLNHSLTTDGLYYIDITYGNLRILAADHSMFPCGTVVKINNGVLNEFYGIVLDTGYAMRNAWSQGVVWMDLAFSSQAEALTGGATSSNTLFSVQRWGW